MLHNTDFYLVSDIYLNRRVKSIVSVMLSSSFFPVKWFLQDMFFRHIEVFTKNNIEMPGSTICLYIDKKGRTLFTCEPNFTVHQPFLTEKRRIKTYFFSLITMVITLETRGVCKTSLYFLFLAFYFVHWRLPYMHTTFRT